MCRRTGSPTAMIVPFRSLAITLAPLSAACVPVSSESADAFAASGELIALSGGPAGAANACIMCHGLAGEGDGAFSPRLAGLDAGYVERQLIAYADGRRIDTQMSYVAGKLTPAQRRAVARYYADMPSPGRTAAALPRGGAEVLYHAGDPARDLPSCAECHGAAGAGVGAAIPPLAGQPSGYLAAQMEKWRKSDRRTDGGDVMLRIAQLLTPSESAALAAYAARLPGGPPSPEYRAASREGHRDGPRNDVSGPPLHVPESARARE